MKDVDCSIETLMNLVKYRKMDKQPFWDAIFELKTAIKREITLAKTDSYSAGYQRAINHIKFKLIPRTYKQFKGNDNLDKVLTFMKNRLMMEEIK